MPSSPSLETFDRSPTPDVANNVADKLQSFALFFTSSFCWLVRSRSSGRGFDDRSRVNCADKISRPALRDILSRFGGSRIKKRKKKKSMSDGSRAINFRCWRVGGVRCALPQCVLSRDWSFGENLSLSLSFSPCFSLFSTLASFVRFFRNLRSIWAEQRRLLLAGVYTSPAELQIPEPPHRFIDVSINVL